MSEDEAVGSSRYMFYVKGVSGKWGEFGFVIFNTGVKSTDKMHLNIDRQLRIGRLTLLQ